MALPAVLSFFLFQRLCLKSGPIFIVAAFAAGSLSVLGAGFLLAFSLVLTGKEFIPAAQTIFLVHLPIMILEGLVTLFVLAFLKKVKPEILTILNQKKIRGKNAQNINCS
jgi:cobalt/nickel transport system permease protein